MRSNADLQIRPYCHPDESSDFGYRRQERRYAAIFEHEDFDLIINAAAYTAVDNAESDKEAAFQVNAVGVEHLARLAKQHAIPLFHVSTDYVFDGETTVAYQETAKRIPKRYTAHQNLREKTDSKRRWRRISF